MGEESFRRTSSQKGVGVSTDVVVVAMPVAALTGILVEKDWKGLKQGALTAVTSVGAFPYIKVCDKGGASRL